MSSNTSPGTGEADEASPFIIDRIIHSLKTLTIVQCVIYLIGFSEGLTHLAALAIYYLFKDDLGLTPPEVSAIFIAPAIPWIIKPVFAFCTDSYPIFGYRRKSYLLIFSLLEAVGFLMLGFSLIPGVVGAILSLFIISFSAAFCSCVAEALVVQKSSGKSHKHTANTVADFIGSKALGSLTVAYFSGYLLEKVSKQSIFVTTAAFPLLITIVTIYMDDDSGAQRRSTPGQLSSMFRFIKMPMIWGPALYIFIYTAGPDYDDALFFFFTNKLGFSPTFMGTLRFTYGLAAILGIIIYKYYLEATSYKQILLWTILISFPIYISPMVLITGLNRQLGISNQMFVLSGGFLIEATAEIQLLPLLVLIATVCPVGLEASVYGLMMSIRNTGGAVSRGLSALVTYTMGITATNFSGLSAYVFICGIFLLLPILVLPLVPDQNDVEKQKKEVASQGVLA